MTEQPEVEMCNCGCGHTKEETITALMESNNCDRAEGERLYDEFGALLATMSEEDIQMVKLLSFLIESQESDSK